ncbi:MAG: FHA domain-containing protein [Planctomycetota bacterium]
MKVEGPVYVIGRNGDCNLAIDDARISRHHCRITFERDGVTIEDLSSRNGTRVNQNIVDSRMPISLFHQDRFQIGGSVFQVSLRNRANQSPITRSPFPGPNETMGGDVIEELEALIASDQSLFGDADQEAPTVLRPSINEPVQKNPVHENADNPSPESSQSSDDGDATAANSQGRDDAGGESADEEQQEGDGQTGKLPAHLKERLRSVTSQHAADAALKSHFNRR